MHLPVEFDCVIIEVLCQHISGFTGFVKNVGYWTGRMCSVSYDYIEEAQAVLYRMPQKKSQ